jgi:hypothetical protein
MSNENVTLKVRGSELLTKGCILEENCELATVFLYIFHKDFLNKMSFYEIQTTDDNYFTSYLSEEKQKCKLNYLMQLRTFFPNWGTVKIGFP